MSASLPRRTGPGQVPQIRSFDPNAEEAMFFPMLRFRPSRPVNAARQGPRRPSLSDNTRHRENSGRADPCGCCGSGCRRLNGAVRKGYFEVVGGDPRSCTGSMRGPATNVCEVDEDDRPDARAMFALPMGDLPIRGRIILNGLQASAERWKRRALERIRQRAGTFLSGPAFIRRRAAFPWINRPYE